MRRTAPEDLEEAKKQIAALQKLITTISRYEGELAKMRKDSESRDRQQREVRVRAAKARAEFDRIKVIYDEEYKQASVKLEALKKTVAEEAKGIDPELLEKYKAIKRHSTPPITRIHDDRCGGCNMQLPAADMNKIRHRRAVCGVRKLRPDYPGEVTPSVKEEDMVLLQMRLKAQKLPL